MEIEKVIVGDWSGDGHGRTEAYLISVPCKFDTSAVYAAGVKEVGHDITDECEEYEEYMLPLFVYEGISAAAEKYGVKMPATEDPEDDGVIMDSHTFFHLWLTTLNIGKQVLYTDTPPIKEYVIDYKRRRDIGGYGLFSG